MIMRLGKSATIPYLSIRAPGGGDGGDVLGDVAVVVPPPVA